MDDGIGELTENEESSHAHGDAFSWGKLIRYQLSAIEWIVQAITPLVSFLIHPLAPIAGVIWILLRPTKLRGLEDAQPRLLAMTKLMSAIALMMSASLGIVVSVAATLHGLGIGTLWMWIVAYSSIPFLWLIVYLVPFPIRQEFAWPSDVPFLNLPKDDG